MDAIIPSAPMTGGDVQPFGAHPGFAWGFRQFDPSQFTGHAPLWNAMHGLPQPPQTAPQLDPFHTWLNGLIARRQQSLPSQPQWPPNQLLGGWPMQPWGGVHYTDPSHGQIITGTGA